MVPRHLAKKLKQAIRQYPVVSVTGPRQSGKTTLVRWALPKYEYVSLENPDEMAFARDDPRGFLNRFADQVILDEIQRTPELFSYIQGIVDKEDRPGRFVLTGSQNFLIHERISQSLAGRCAILFLLPFSHAELKQKNPVDPDTLGKLRQKKTSEEQKLFDTMFKGGYPRIHDKDLNPNDWLANYSRTYLERDVRNIVNVGNIETFTRFLRLCAGRCGQLLNLSSIAVDCGISHDSARRWLSILESSFIIYLLRPHHKNFNKRLVKSPKLYFLDTGLLCYLLRIRNPDELEIHPGRGAIFESWIISETIKAYFNQAREPDIFFWRDSSGHEIDLLLDRGREILPAEIKSGQTVTNDFFTALNYWRKLSQQPDLPASLIYAGTESFQRLHTSVISWSQWT
ncbi:MAG: ATP-binding protein [Sedimentisphaerales bacterium]|nr:ATP-binding protein [Sedimentisphaerales bacterium]